MVRRPRPDDDAPMSTSSRSIALIILAGFLALSTEAGAATSTQAFTTPGEHQFVVPEAVTSVHVVLVGASGGSGVGGSPGGKGASFGATLAVTPGQTLFAEVGGNGTRAVAGQADGLGGAGGGGNGGNEVFLFVGAPGGGGGGGASDVRTGPSLATRLAVAGGGAGGGGTGSDASAAGMILGGGGGSGGGPGGPGGPDPHGDLGGQPGQQGDQNSGGAPGANSAENPATAGDLALGGAGGTTPAGGGGGGGGGLYGCGGGGAGTATIVDPNKLIIATAGGGGGGGGSSGVPSTASGVSSAAVQQSAPGAPASATFSWTTPAPSAATAAASSVTAGAATLTGTVNPNGSAVTDCHFQVSPPPAGGADVPCAQQIGAGSSPVAVTANVAGLKGATAYRYTLVASSAAGSGSGAPVDFTTSGNGAPPVGSGTPGPALTALKLKPSRFRARAGTTIAYSLSQRARVTIRFERLRGGRFVKVPGALHRSSGAGPARIRFGGIVGGHRLAPGRYRVSAVAGTMATPRRASGTVLR